MDQKKHDIVIVGGGLIGSSIACFLARSGQDVCVVEKHCVGHEGSGRSGGIIRQNLRPPAELKLAMRSLAIWKMLAEESDVDFEFNQHGTIKLVWNDKEAQEAREFMNRQKAAGLECDFLDRSEVKQLLPSFTPDYIGGLYSPSCASAEPYLSCVGVARLAERVGAKFYSRTTVTGIQVRNGNVSAARTDQGDILTGLVINAAGPWAQSINKMVGYKTPGNLCRSHIVVTEQLPPLIGPSVSCGNYGYFRQTRSGNVLIGFSSIPVSDYTHRLATFEALSTATRRAATIIPRLRPASAIRTFTGFTKWTPDLLPIVGYVQEPKGFYIAAEFNATGFAIGPGIGELVSEHLLNGKTSLPIDSFCPDRFQPNNNLQEK